MSRGHGPVPDVLIQDPGVARVLVELVDESVDEEVDHPEVGMGHRFAVHDVRGPEVFDAASERLDVEPAGSGPVDRTDHGAEAGAGGAGGEERETGAGQDRWIEKGSTIVSKIVEDCAPAATTSAPAMMRSPSTSSTPVTATAPPVTRATVASSCATPSA